MKPEPGTGKHATGATRAKTRHPNKRRESARNPQQLYLQIEWLIMTDK